MKTLDLLLDLTCYDGPATNVPNSSPRLKAQIRDANIDAALQAQIMVPGGAVDQVIPLASASSDYLIVQCDQDLTAKINGGSQVVSLKPKGAGARTLVLFLRGPVTGLLLSNPGVTTANVDVISLNR
jgi:hypothetical protein